jgi:hypothetical protein
LAVKRILAELFVCLVLSLAGLSYGWACCLTSFPLSFKLVVPAFFSTMFAEDCVLVGLLSLVVLFASNYFCILSSSFRSIFIFSFFTPTLSILIEFTVFLVGCGVTCFTLPSLAVIFFSGGLVEGLSLKVTGSI